MKKKLPKRSLVVKERLDAILNVILSVAEDKLAMVILFGSYARGDWVEDEYMENHTSFSYQSDLDIMLVMKKAKYTGLFGSKIEERIEKILEFLRLDDQSSPGLIRGKPPVSLIIESIQKVNEGLEKGRYFYTDIKREGVMLYNSGEFELAKAKKLTFEEWYEIAQDDYDDWFPYGCSFLIDVNHCIERGHLKKAAFELHQATECFYSAISLVFSGKRPKLHDLKKLKKRVSRYDKELLKIFPIHTPEQKKCFDLLIDAYVKARYDRNYKIEKEQLLYLIERVEKLKDVTERICLQKLNDRENETKLL